MDWVRQISLQVATNFRMFLPNKFCVPWFLEWFSLVAWTANSLRVNQRHVNE